MAITITSDAFPAHGAIPQKYTGEGADVSPPLAWSGVPQGTKELALICDDPDAPTPTPWVHWVVYHIPPMQTGLAEGARQNLTKDKTTFTRPTIMARYRPRGMAYTITTSTCTP